MMRMLMALAAILLAGCADAVDVLTSDYEYGSIEVEALRRNGEPIPGVELTLHGGGRHMGYGVTDESGRFVFDFVPEGEYGLFATPAEPYVARPTTNIRDEIRLEEAQTETVAFTFLRRGPGTIEVLAVDEASGEPVGGAEVTLYTFRGGIREDVTDASGRVVFDPVPFGEYGVSIDPPGLYVAEPGRGTSFVDEIVVDEGSLATLRFPLTRCDGRIVVRTSLSDGSPAPGVNAIAYRFGEVLAGGRTDEQGRLDFGPLPCGDVGVSLRPTPGYLFEDGRGTSFVDGLAVTSGSVRTLDFTVEACRGRVRAAVRDASGAPVPGARLTLYTYLGIESEATTGADGTHLFDDVPCFSGYGLSVDPPAGYSVEPGKGSSYVDGIDIEDGTEEQVSFELIRTS